MDESKFTLGQKVWAQDYSTQKWVQTMIISKPIYQHDKTGPGWYVGRPIYGWVPESALRPWVRGEEKPCDTA